MGVGTANESHASEIITEINPLELLEKYLSSEKVEYKNSTVKTATNEPQQASELTEEEMEILKEYVISPEFGIIMHTYEAQDLFKIFELY